MRVVYSLAIDLAANPERVAKTQALTMNADKPLLGLRGAHGLFASPEWWSNIDSGSIRSETLYGTIEGLHFAGQDARWGDQVNTFSMRLADGTLINEGIVVNEKSYRRLFRVGTEMRIRYALEELKRQPATEGGVNYIKILLEIAVNPEGSST
ncbi:hypothetical protein CDL60_08950 [Roseateles noduli]|nr:hypothetical protein CDL60_08950 [Roseateles noduli]